MSPWMDLGGGVTGQNSTFSNYGHVANKIKGNNECSKLVANILPADPPPPLTLWVKRSKIIFFSEHGHDSYQIKEN